MSEPALRIIGRHSSHFTRTVLIFAEELGLGYDFEPVYDLGSSSAQGFAGNPALRVPALRTEAGRLFGTLGICRELARRAAFTGRIVWPEDLDAYQLQNAQELISNAMASEVTVVMAEAADIPVTHAFLRKPLASLTRSLHWLDASWPEIRTQLPPRAVSFLEVTLFCLVTHLSFRKVLSTEPWANLQSFCDEFGARPAAQRTAYYFDAVPGAS
jgi:glutathione S-transferase